MSFALHELVYEKDYEHYLADFLFKKQYDFNK